MAERTDVIKVDRGLHFDPAEWSCNGWTVEREDARSRPIEYLPLEQLHFIEPYWKGASPGHIRLDAYVFQALWTYRVQLPVWWQSKIPLGSRFFQVYLDGTVFLNEFGVECVYYLRYGPDLFQPEFGKPLEYRWFWGWTPVGKKWGHNFPALALPLNR